jgi:hypothetical protein
MPNMSYCRFENTLGDMNDCLNALEERNVSSNSERRKASKMLNTICKFLAGEGIIEDYDISVIDDIIEECMEEKEDDAE